LQKLEPIEEYENEDSLEISHGATVEATICELKNCQLLIF